MIWDEKALEGSVRSQKAALQNKTQVCDQMLIFVTKSGNYRCSYYQKVFKHGNGPQIRAAVVLEEGSCSRRINAHRSGTPPAAGWLFNLWLDQRWSVDPTGRYRTHQVKVNLTPKAVISFNSEHSHCRPLYLHGHFPAGARFQRPLSSLAVMDTTLKAKSRGCALLLKQQRRWSSPASELQLLTDLWPPCEMSWMEDAP